VYLKYASVSQQLIVPKLEDLVLRYRSLKVGEINCQQKYFTLIFFCLFAGWGEHHGEQGWLQAGEDLCGRSRKVVHFEIMRRMDFSVLCKHIHICIHRLPKLHDVFASKD
jgi:hypothetical protein